MWQNLLGVFTSVWQLHLAVAGLVYQNNPIGQTLAVVLIGSTTGFTMLYLSFDVFKLLWLGLKWLRRLIWPDKKIIVKPNCWNNQRTTIRDRAIQWMVKHQSPRVVIFLVVAIPIPFTEYPAVIASRYVKIPQGYLILLAANSIRTVLVVLGGYYLGGKI